MGNLATPICYIRHQTHRRRWLVSPGLLDSIPFGHHHVQLQLFITWKKSQQSRVTKDPNPETPHNSPHWKLDFLSLCQICSIQVFFLRGGWTPWNLSETLFWGWRLAIASLGLSPVARVSGQGTQAVGYCFGGCHEKTFGNLTGLATDCTKGHAREDVNVVNLVMALSLVCKGMQNRAYWQSQ